MLAITGLMGLGWALGITSAHFQLDGLVITFLVTHLLLSIVILILRCILDQQVSTFTCSVLLDVRFLFVL